MRALCLVAVLSTPAFADPVTAPACREADPKAPPPRSVRDVDWCNSDAFTWKGRLRAGHAEVHLYRRLDQPHDTIRTRLRGVIYGDLDGDGRAEAAVVIEKSTWTTSHQGTVSTVYVHGFTGGAPVLLGSIPAGTPVRDVAFGKGGTVTVKAGDPATVETYVRDPAGAFVRQP
ncbi:MAG: hypothetical protein KF773_27815 [Deltaproteobacteria bacterium]|nr:hypothetical protein [Deltaproteobacteria bacterium]